MNGQDHMKRHTISLKNFKMQIHTIKSIFHQPDWINISNFMIPKCPWRFEGGMLNHNYRKQIIWRKSQHSCQSTKVSEVCIFDPQFSAVSLPYGHSETKKQKICIRLFMISLVTYTTSNLNAYQQEIAQLNNGSYKQWTMFSFDIKTVISPVCKSLC